MTDVCLPFLKNFDCLRLALRGIKKFVPDARLVLHVQLPEEVDAVVKMVGDAGLPFVVASTGPALDMTEVLDRLFSKAESRVVVFGEQDMFLVRSIVPLIAHVDSGVFDIMAPLDVHFFDGFHARHMPLYGDIGRLCPRPGYLHSALMVMDRAAVSTVAGAKPFRLDPDVPLFGRGVLGAESYYGLAQRYIQKNLRSRIGYLRQLHAPYGYGASLFYGEVEYAYHLFYSSTKDGYLKHGALTAAEHAWLVSEENRFLSDYESGQLIRPERW